MNTSSVLSCTDTRRILASEIVLPFWRPRSSTWRLSVPQLFACTSDVSMFWNSKMDMWSVILFKSSKLLYLCFNHSFSYWDQLLSYIHISIHNYFSCYLKKWFTNWDYCRRYIHFFILLITNSEIWTKVVYYNCILLKGYSTPCL